MIYRKFAFEFRICKIALGSTRMPTTHPAAYRDESRPAFPELTGKHPLVVFGDHGFCAGEQLEVQCMPAPHMHSQVELNFLLRGAMTYWFDGREITVGEGRLALFWGMIPHQVVACEDGTTFVCLYVPMSVLLALPTVGALRDEIFRGALVEALRVRPYDRDIFLSWRDDLLSGDRQTRQIVHDELTARIRRIARDGRRDLRDTAHHNSSAPHHDADRLRCVELMVRFIAQHGLEQIGAADVARASNLHPNYAMGVFRRSVGLTIKQAIVRHRLDTAQSLLIGTDNPVTAIAYECGFGSLSSFYENFEKRFQVSPRQFRSSLPFRRA
jgi:AraC-like DNA-binding protein